MEIEEHQVRTIQIPTSKLIKYIPSEPDGGVIPGKVLFCERPFIVRQDSYSFTLHYVPRSVDNQVTSYAACRLDEELELVEGSNVYEVLYPPEKAALINDGVSFYFESGRDVALWGRYNKSKVLMLPDPFDALGTHQLSSFVRAGLSHIACCSTMHNIRLAIIKKGANLISPTVIESTEPVTFGPPCQHNVGWLIPWASQSKGINIEWLDDAEMDQFIENAGPLPKV